MRKSGRNILVYRLSGSYLLTTTSDRLLKSLSPRSGVKAAVSKPASGTKTNGTTRKLRTSINRGFSEEEGLTSALACLAEKEKWEPLLRAKDNLLRQKDLVIERFEYVGNYFLSRGSELLQAAGDH